MAKPNTVLLMPQKQPDSYDEGRVATGQTGVIPGMLFDRNANNEVVKQAVAAGGFAPPWFVYEDDLRGRTIDQTYEPGDFIRLHKAMRGDRIYALLAPGQNADEDGYVAAAGPGAAAGLLKVAAGTDVRIARVYEAANNTAGGVPMRVRIEVL